MSDREDVRGRDADVRRPRDVTEPVDLAHLETRDEAVARQRTLVDPAPASHTLTELWCGAGRVQEELTAGTDPAPGPLRATGAMG